MKKKIGHYSWIHALKSASWEAKIKGHEMQNLQEEKARKISDPSKIQKAEAALKYVPPVHKISGEAKSDDKNVDISPIDIKDDQGNTINRIPYNMARLMMLQGMKERTAEGLKDWQRSTPASVAQAGGQEGVFTNLEQMKRAEEAARLRSYQEPIDAAPEEDAEKDAEDWTIGDPPSFSVPQYPLAAQARAETDEIERMKDVDLRSKMARQLYAAGSRAKRIAARQAQSEAQYQADQEAKQESIEGIVDRMMRGKTIS